MPQPIRIPAQGDLRCGTGGTYPACGEYPAAGGGEYAGVGGGGNPAAGVGWLPSGRQAAPSQ